MVVPDQMIDMTIGQARFFGSGAVAHVSMADPPICPAVADILTRLMVRGRRYWRRSMSSLRQRTFVLRRTAVFRAESNWYRQMQADIVGMTNMPEAKLAQ
jgi:5'-methylthioadenosine phosphorylase